MDPSWPENFSGHRKKAFQELIQGRELAHHLRAILAKPFGSDDDWLAAAEDLATKILGSFAKTITMMNCSTTDEVSQFPASVGPCWGGRKSDDSGESWKTSWKDRRGCYKRRKTSETWTKTTTTLTDDGHAWRKYGQKAILNARHPRNYFRCTHKFEQGCLATKQVQKIEDDPPMFRTTYYGHHTCKNLHKASQIISDYSSPGDSSSFLLNFGSSQPNSKSDDPFPQTFPLLKHEDSQVGKMPSWDHNQTSSSDYFLSPDLTAFGSSGPIAGLSSGSDHGDVISSGVYSCTESNPSHSLDMDMLVGNVDFDDAFPFEF